MKVSLKSLLYASIAVSIASIGLAFITYASAENDIEAIKSMDMEAIITQAATSYVASEINNGRCANAR